MKKVFLLLLAIFMLTSATAFAGLDFMREPMQNYTKESTFKVSFESAKDVVSIFEELGGDEEISFRVNPESFLSTFLSLEGNTTVQSDISEDMKKGEISVVTQHSQNIDINTNLDVSYTAERGIWISYDFTNEENLGLRMITSSPMSNKYVVYDIAELLSEDEAFILRTMVSKALNPEFISKIKVLLVNSVEKNSVIRTKKNEVTVTTDNTGFLNIMREVSEAVADELFAEIPKDEKEKIENVLKSVFESNITVLGKDGIRTTYSLYNGRISKITTQMDICIGVSEIYSLITEKDWDFISEGKIEFDILFESRLSNVGTTKVQFPMLDKNNSVTIDELNEILYGGYYEEDWEYEFTYPYAYAGAYCEKLPVIDGKYYVPLRKTMECAYEDSVDIAFEKGVITLSSDYFPGFSTLTLANGSSKAYTEQGEYEIGTVFIDETNTTYVNHELFEKVFGWSIESVTHYVTENEYYYSFNTYQYE